MPTIKDLDALNGEMTEWRHALHQKPEMAFEEEWTSDYIAEKLESFGIEIHRACEPIWTRYGSRKPIPSLIAHNTRG